MRSAMHPAAGGRGPARPFGHYGYLWWVHGEDDSSSLPAGSFSALGLGGQAHSVIPSHGLVIVAMSDNRKGGNYRMAIPDAVVNAVLELDMIVSLES
jgi:CubicO group peptidase (beta-lactamase class C family)